MALRMRHVEFVIVGVLALVGCRDRAHSRDAADTRARVRVVLDGADVARITSADLATRRPLADVLPAGARDVATWELVTATTDDGRSLILEDVAARYPAHTLALVLDGGRPTLALFPPVRADQPAHVQRALAQPAIALAGVTRVDVDRDAPDDEAADERAELVVIDRGREARLDIARLDALPRTKGGWDLREVLTAAGVGAQANLSAIGREGRATFTRAELDRPEVRGTLRWNRRGALRLAIDRGDSDLVVHDVVRIEVIPP